ncbi:MAG: hypothetical protein EU549_01870 [Promethearchaeota archaeon]|nr:MAG: hypothetical protein EU549_01870 [Candidatus Lokiarchaeota archaeon]
MGKIEKYIEKYLPEIEPFLEGAEIRYKFYGVFYAPWLGEMNGLFVLTDDAFFVRGKAGFKSGWAGMAKSGEVQKIPYSSFQTFYSKKHKAVIKYDGAFKGKPGKIGKMTIAPKKMEGENKQDLIARANEYYDFLKSKANITE